MRGFLLRLLLNTLALWIVTQLYGGLFFAKDSSLGDYILAGLIFGLANALLKPVLLLLTLPFNILTLGLFTLVVNALIVLVVASLTPLDVRGFGGALVGAVLLSVISFGLNLLVGPSDCKRVNRR